jgi:hypothetical protein
VARVGSVFGTQRSARAVSRRGSSHSPCREPANGIDTERTRRRHGRDHERSSLSRPGRRNAFEPLADIVFAKFRTTSVQDEFRTRRLPYKTERRSRSSTSRFRIFGMRVAGDPLGGPRLSAHDRRRPCGPAQTRVQKRVPIAGSEKVTESPRRGRRGRGATRADLLPGRPRRARDPSRLIRVRRGVKPEIPFSKAGHPVHDARATFRTWAPRGPNSPGAAAGCPPGCTLRPTRDPCRGALERRSGHFQAVRRRGLEPLCQLRR